VSEPVSEAVRARLTQVAEAAGERIKLFSDMVQFAGPLLRPDPVYDPAAVEKALKPGAELLRTYRDKLAATEAWEPAALETLLKDVAPEKDRHKALVAATRVAVTGVTVGFGLYETLAILGKPEALRRVELGLSRI
jgi:nondiscriminating glutamyl-tRNA synthetase